MEDDIDEFTIIGYESEGYTKNDIINNVYFCLEETLANIFYYCTVLVQNIPYKENIKEIHSDYLISFTNKIDSIQFENITKRVLSKIVCKTLGVSDFILVPLPAANIIDLIIVCSPIFNLYYNITKKSLRMNSSGKREKGL
jgi:hypothetical protein